MSELGKLVSTDSQPWDCSHCGSPACRITVYEGGMWWDCGHLETWPIGATEAAQ